MPGLGRAGWHLASFSVSDTLEKFPRIIAPNLLGWVG